MTERVIEVNELARVEGEGALYVRLNGRQVERVEFKIHEPPRFFEALLRGRDAMEVPDITSRICGICPIAYIMSSSQAVEDATGVAVTPDIHALRRMLYCGEWIQSHVLHAAMLHAPDFLNLHDAIAIAQVNPDLVKKALRLKKAGNMLMEVIGGRAVHPVNTRVGGFYKAPSRQAIAAMIPELDWGAQAAREVALAFAGFTFPQDETDYIFVSLIHDTLYPICEGRIGSNRGLDIPASGFNDHFVEEHVARSNALQGRMRDGSPYLVGPLARYANNYHLLSEAARQTARDCGLGEVERNPYKSILVRMVEVQYAFEEAARLARAYQEPSPAFIEIPHRAGVGHACTEAPRGICYHRYEVDAQRRVVMAQIVPPTSQNQPQIEADLARVVAANLDMDDAALQWRCEQTIRNYDPCISCATHFLKLTVERV
ncbi:MAG: Ni/Fe hydrogenase subunit alpha [Limimaricola sp.]|uniref:Ni/Fe hydrogenase subunit alpha n=1 Tax=Limimaricola sp. TaxID=2211665 RepID=UPI001D9AC9EF|nr:nickel-dependent hydrogenase large subunit [Limimaricola sp.]MBI1418145.1 Ni/Fe hydrogenase subunit alpha [Limimaricola sp.]